MALSRILCAVLSSLELRSMAAADMRMYANFRQTKTPTSFTIADLLVITLIAMYDTKCF